MYIEKLFNIQSTYLKKLRKYLGYIEDVYIYVRFSVNTNSNLISILYYCCLVFTRLLYNIFIKISLFRYH